VKTQKPAESRVFVAPQGGRWYNGALPNIRWLHVHAGHSDRTSSRISVQGNPVITHSGQPPHMESQRNEQE
jgi:hypothetical protein